MCSIGSAPDPPPVAVTADPQMITSLIASGTPVPDPLPDSRGKGLRIVPRKCPNPRCQSWGCAAHDPPPVEGMRHVGWYHRTSGYLTKGRPDGLEQHDEYAADPILPVYAPDQNDGSVGR